MAAAVVFHVTAMISLACGNENAQPNIVFILVDDYGFNDIGYHAREHQSDMKTPFLDELASKGVKLENYYVQPICTPSRSQLLSGRYQIHTGLQHGIIWPDQPNALPLNNVLLPEHLRGCGYTTHMVGKWHIGFYKSEFLPWNRGFDTYFGYLAGGEDYFSHSSCYKGMCGVDMWSSMYGPVNNTWGEYSAHLFTRKAIEAIDHRDTSKPMFLYVAYQSVHSPMEVPDKYVKPFSHIKDRNRRTYAGMVLAMDESIRNLTKHIEEVGILDNTIIVFSTDNGGQTLYGGNNWPLRGRKGSLWEGGVRGVGFTYGKALGIAGATYSGLLHISDWLPTLLDAASCSRSHTQPLDGYNQWDAIRKKASPPRDEILHNIDPLFQSEISASFLGSKFNTSVHAAIRKGPWKLLTGDPGFAEWIKPPESVQDVIDIPEWFSSKTDRGLSIKLFNIDTDPYEYSNVAHEYPHVVEELLERLAFYNSTAVPVKYPKPDPKANPNFHGGYWRPWQDEL